MKRSFYEILGVPHDASQSQIDSAFTRLSLGASTSMRGTTETLTELNLIRDGYQLLSDPAKRAKYDAKLMAAETGVQLMFSRKAARRAASSE